jgi:hypothetical protein
MRAAAASLAMAWIGLGLGTACSDRPRIDIAHVDVVDGERFGLDRAAEGLVRRMRSAPGVGRGGAESQLQVRVADLRGPQPRGAPEWRAVVAAELAPLGRSEIGRLTVTASASATSGDAAVAAAVERVAERLQVRWSMARASDRAVLAALRGSDPAGFAAAMEEAGRRRLSDAAALVARRLPELGHRNVLDAVAVLVDIGDPSVAVDIIATTDRQPARFWPPIIYALGQLGGPEARGFLFTVAQGHREPALRSAAAEALRTLEAREGRSSTDP